jgi:hypothetical protein
MTDDERIRQLIFTLADWRDELGTDFVSLCLQPCSV